MARELCIWMFTPHRNLIECGSHSHIYLLFLRGAIEMLSMHHHLQIFRTYLNEVSRLKQRSAKGTNALNILKWQTCLRHERRNEQFRAHAIRPTSRKGNPINYWFSEQLRILEYIELLVVPLQKCWHEIYELECIQLSFDELRYSNA